MYKILFFGTSEFAVPSLRALQDDGRFEIAGIVTQPDRPVGRHAKVTASPIKKNVGSTCVIQQPEKLSDPDFKNWISEIGASCEAFIVISYGKILPQWLLDIPTQGVINIHGSILPKWRGASPIQAAIRAGDAITGITIMKMDAGLDHGPIISIQKEKILDTDTGGSLHDRLAHIGGNMLPNILCDYFEGKIMPIEQAHLEATSCRTLTRDDGKIDWNMPAIEIERMIRAYTPWPGAWTIQNEKRIKIHSAKIGSNNQIEILTLQPEGKKIMDFKTFLRGNTWN